MRRNKTARVAIPNCENSLPETMKKAFIQTYGCQMNDHDSQRMAAMLRAEQYEMTTDVNEASLIIVNTCSVRENPENKVYSLLGKLRRLKQEKSDLIIGVGGCVAQQEGETILKREKAVDMVFGPDNLFALPEMLKAVEGGERVLRTEWQPRDKKIQNFIPEEWIEEGHVDGVKAYISITKGCDNFCSFCIVPTTRGREVSREADNILREAQYLIDKGAQEIWLLGQNVNSYQARDYGFYELLDCMSQLEGLRRIRFTSPYPNDWTNTLSDLMAARPTICNQLHLPYQSGSDRILKAMRRGHTRDAYLEKIAYMKSINPSIELSTDLIVGFPMETEDDFQRTLDVLEHVRFSMVYPFKYSSRPGTKAASYKDDVPREVKEERLRRVIELQRSITDEDVRSYIGTTQEVLIDGANTKRRHAMSGRTDGYRPVSIHDPKLEIGDLVNVTITDTEGHWLIGDVLHEPALSV